MAPRKTARRKPTSTAPARPFRSSWQMPLALTRPGVLEYTAAKDPQFRALLLVVSPVDTKVLGITINDKIVCDEMFFKSWKRHGLMHPKSPDVDEYSVQLFIKRGDVLKLTTAEERDVSAMLVGFVATELE